jgi:hypothetical protein
MKRYILLIFSIFLGLYVSAQTPKQEVIASAGGYNTNGTLAISWTLGETIIPTFTSGSLILTHGFQQDIWITDVEKNIDSPVKITVFPNPASDNINILFDEPTDTEVNVYLLDSQGKLLKTGVIENATSETEMNLQDIPAGIYYLKLIKGNLSNVYKVVKL